KMALGFWRHRGEKRTGILALEGAYHGDTVGGMSVGERGVFNAPYDPLLFDVERLPFPHQGREEVTLQALNAACGKGSVAALIVEPLILGAGGMLIYAPEVLLEMKRICETHGVLFIADEVMTGWGRTGTLFACEQARVTPDIACYSKGLTGGSLPLAVTLCRADIFDAHLSSDRSRTFFHSSSYTANPIACAAALANLTVWQNAPVLKRIETLDLNVSTSGYLSDVGPQLKAFFRNRDLLIRPLGNVIYLMTPYCVTSDDLDRAYAAIDEAADAITGTSE